MTTPTAPSEAPRDDPASDERTPTAGPPHIAHYRVVRRAPDRHGGRVCQAAVDDGAGARTSVTIVTFDGDRGPERAMHLIERLELLAGECIPRVLDVCLDENADPAVVLDFCGEAMSSVVASGTLLRGGELVTLLAPIFAALTTLHDRGFVHGAVSSSAVAVGANGRPVLLGCERALALGSSGDRRDQDRRAADDLRAFADLIVDLAEAVVDSQVRVSANRAAAALRAGSGTPFSASVRSAVEVRLFEIAEPEPLTFAAGVDIAAHSRPERAVRALVSEDRRRRRGHAPSNARTAARRAVVGVRGTAAAAIDRASAFTRPATRWVRTGGRTRRLLVAAGGSAIAAALVVLVMPAGDATGDGSRAASTPTASAPVEPAPASGVRGSVESSATGDDRPTPSAPAPSREDDDAVAGARGSLDALAGCAAAGGADCWEAAVEPRSVLLGTLVTGGAHELPSALRMPVEALDITQREDFGDARLVALSPLDGTESASVLMVRTEAGWRIREVFAP
jgi:hypothetical protein